MIGVVFGNIRHAFHIGVWTGFFEEFGDFRGSHMRGRQVGTVATAFAICSVALAAFIGNVAFSALRN